jgi:uncharacterized protein
LPRVNLRLLLFGAAFLLFFLLPSSIEFYTDWLWFGETGYQSVFLRVLTTQFLLGALGFALVFAVLLANLRLAMRAAPRREFVVMTPEGPRTITVDPVRLRPLLYLLAAGGALLSAFYAASQWETWLYYLNATAFGQTDPILGHDVGFYVFSLPFYQFIQGFLLTLVIVSAIVSGLAYGLSGMLGFDPVRGLYVHRNTTRHLSILAAALFVLLAAGAWLGQAALLTTDTHLIRGASYVDVHARLPLLRILMVVALVSAVLAAAQTFSARRWLIGAAAGAYLIVALASAGYAAALQRFVVDPNEQSMETPYIIHNIDATRRAFALDTAVERELSGDALLTRADIEANAATFRNVPLWDHQPLLDTFSQIQEIRTYYDFVSVHNDRYVIDGEYRQIMLSARELNSASLPNRTWINERLTFTHGYGLTLGPVNQVTAEGLPVLFIGNLPPESTVDLQVHEPSIYYGQLSSDHVFVRTATREFHYPKGDDNIFTTYEGDGGVPVGGFFRKAIFSLKFRSMKTLLTNDLNPDSRVMYYRRVQERVRKIAPFLMYEDDRYLAISEGRLFWVQDAYTITNRFPYSSRATRNINYIRNSIKVVVDAYHGHTRYYLVDPEDPIAQTVSKAFPGLLRPLSEMPEGLRTRLRYPQGIFQLQAQMLSTFHMMNPAVFYNKEDQWEIPALETRGGQLTRMQPWYTIMKLPGEPEAEFIQMLPFTPRQKDNLASWMVARSDGEHYGKLMIFQFPKQKVIFGPRQVVARINQDQVISPQITLWNQQGSEVIQGTLLVLPIEEALIYVRPLYLRAAGGRIPELKRVIVAYQNQIVMEETLDGALNRIFPGGPGRAAVDARPGVEPAAAPGDPASPAEAARQPAAAATGPDVARYNELAGQARMVYGRALQAQRDGNWAAYGDEIRRLGEILEQLALRPPAAPQATPPPQP